MTKRIGLFLCAVTALAAHANASTLVRFETSLGDVDVRLFDTATPASVANFLNYVTDGDYDDSFIHRAPPNFVVQGGGFTFPEGGGVTAVPTDPPVINEPGLTNIRGTLAYAKLGGDPNSATSGWFFNTNNNAVNLNNQNGGFTVFGAVVGDGLSVVDAIASQQIVNAGSPFETLPVLDTFSPPNILREDLVFINRVSVLNLADGDYNFDGVVDTADYAVWRNQFGGSLRIIDQPDVSPLVDADGNGDGVVDLADYQIWLDNLGVTSSTQPLPLAIPEPSSLLLVGLLAAAASCRRA